MDLLSEYTVVVNNLLSAIMMTGTIISTVLVFLLLYYYYVEKTELVKHIIYYFGASLLGLLADSFIVLISIDRVYLVSYSQFKVLELFSEYLTVLTLFLLLQYLVRVYHRRMTHGLLILMFLIIIIGHVVHNQELMLLVFTCMAMGSFMVIVWPMKRWKFIGIAIGIILIYGVVFIVESYVIELYYFQWVIDALSAIIAVIYFMSRYKVIYDEKNHLYERLTKDYLTSAYSKSYFLEEIEKKAEGTIVFIDINKFKWVNDNLGHLEGDKLLKRFASKMEPHPNLMFCRFGGDEFTLYIDSTEQEALEGIERLVQAMFKEALSEIKKDVNSSVGISIGMCCFDKYHSLEALTEADQLMYSAKDGGNYKSVMSNLKEAENGVVN